MFDFFGTRWNDLAVSVVETFLADGRGPHLGGKGPSHRDAVRKAVWVWPTHKAGFSLSGLNRDSGDAWKLNGVTFRSPEPKMWLSSVIAQGISPAPRFDVKTFERRDGRAAAVVGVEPIAVPPCVTAAGVIYQRVTGQTLPVTDQRVLAELYDRGRAARGQSELLALRAADRALNEPAILPADEVQLSVALCPVGGADDTAASSSHETSLTASRNA